MAYAYALKSIGNEVLKIIDDEEQRTLHVIAPDREGALDYFGKELDKTFSLAPLGEACPTTYLLAEHDYTQGCYWLDFRIPVFETL